MIRIEGEKMLVFDNRTLTTIVFDIPKKLSSITRWSKWVKRGSEKETVLEHTFSQAFVTILLCEELKRNNRISDEQAYNALACALVHDIGEMEYGDKLDYKKTSRDEERERSFIYQYLSSIDSSLLEAIISIYDVQEGAKRDDDINRQRVENQIFGLAEKTCYFMYALRQYQREPKSENSRDLWYHVFRRQSGGLKQRAHNLGLSEKAFPFLGSEEEGER